MNDDDGAGRKAQPGWSGRAHSEFTYGTITLGGPASLRTYGLGLNFGADEPDGGNQGGLASGEIAGVPAAARFFKAPGV